MPVRRSHQVNPLKSRRVAGPGGKSFVTREMQEDFDRRQAERRRELAEAGKKLARARRKSA